MRNIKEYFSIWVRGQDTKTRNIEDKSIISTLSGHRDAISALYNVNIGELVSGSEDKSLIIWNKSTPESSIYSLIQLLTEHKSCIYEIIRINNIEIMSGEYLGSET